MTSSLRCEPLGLGVHVKNLYNLYVYFWRWALWKVFEHKRQGPASSASSPRRRYLRRPGLRGDAAGDAATFDELWILDLGGDNLGARKTENVFAIQTPVAIAVGRPQAEGAARDARDGPLHPVEGHGQGSSRGSPRWTASTT